MCRDTPSHPSFVCNALVITTSLDCFIRICLKSVDTSHHPIIMAGLIPVNQLPGHPNYNAANPAVPLVVPNFAPFQVNQNGPQLGNPAWNDPHPQVPGWPTAAQLAAGQGGIPTECCWRSLVPGDVQNPLSAQIQGGWQPCDDQNLPAVHTATHIFYIYTRNSGPIQRQEEYDAANAIVAGRLLQRLRNPDGTVLPWPIVVVLVRKGHQSASVTIPATTPNVRNPMLVEIMDRLTVLQSRPPHLRPQMPHVWLVSRSMSSFSVAPVRTAWGAFVGKYGHLLHHMSMIYQVEAHFPAPDPPMPPAREIPWIIDWVYSMKYIRFPLRYLFAQPPADSEEARYMPRVLAFRSEEWAARNNGFADINRARVIRFTRGNARLQI
jgi:hypothetical protein